MKKFRLNNDTMQRIFADTGMKVNEIASSDVLAVDACIEDRSGKHLRPAVDMAGLNPRGSVYLMFNRFFTKEDIDKAIARIRP